LCVKLDNSTLRAVLTVWLFDGFCDRLLVGLSLMEGTVEETENEEN